LLLLIFYSSSKSIEFVNFKNDFKCLVISSCLLIGQIPAFAYPLPLTDNLGRWVHKDTRPREATGRRSREGMASSSCGRNRCLVCVAI
jgi:hypothetical protein